MTADSLKDVFEKRLIPPATLPASFDKPLHKINRLLARAIPNTTTDPMPEKFFSAKWTEEDIEWLKDHLSKGRGTLQAKTPSFTRRF